MGQIRPNLNVTAAVREALPRLEGESTYHDVTAEICRRYPGIEPHQIDKNVASALSQLARRGLVENTGRVRGRAAIYRRRPTQPGGEGG